MAKCDICSKGVVIGRSVSHSKRHVSRRFSGNIHPTTLLMEGKLRRLNICTRCLRTYNKAPV